MKLCELMEQLRCYNQEAKVAVIVHNKCEEFSIAFGGGDGATKENCTSVGFYVDDLNGQEHARE